MSRFIRFHVRTPLRGVAGAALLGGACLAAQAGDGLGLSGATVELPWSARVAAVEARLLRSDDRTPVAALPWMADALPALEPSGLLHGLPRHADWRLSLHWGLAGGWSFGLVPGVAVDADVYGRRFPGGTLAVVLGKAWTPRWRTFVDLAGDRRTPSRTDGSPLALDLGLSYIASPSIQLDVALTRGIASSGAPLSAGAGIVARF